MRAISRLRPSPSMAVALIALFVALGGVGYAAATGSIDSRELKNDTVRSKDVRNNGLLSRDVRNGQLRGADVADDSLQGADIDESTLGKVPNSASADTAQTAQSAQTAQTATSVGGARIVPVKHRSGDVTTATVFDEGGLQLLVSCAASDEELIARTTVAGGEILAISDDAFADDGDAVNLVHNLDDSFGPGEDFDLQDTATASDDRLYQLHYLGGDGVDVTAHLVTEDDLGGNNYIVSGYAVVT